MTFTPPECVSKFSFCFYLVAFSIGYIVVYSIFFLGAVLDEKFAKQNGHFEEILYSNVLVKYYGIQWLLEEKIFLKKPPLMAVNFKFMTEIDIFVVQFILNL